MHALRISFAKKSGLNIAAVSIFSSVGLCIGWISLRDRLESGYGCWVVGGGWVEKKKKKEKYSGDKGEEGVGDGFEISC